MMVAADFPRIEAGLVGGRSLPVRSLHWLCHRQPRCGRTGHEGVHVQIHRAEAHQLYHILCRTLCMSDGPQIEVAVT